LVFGFFNFYFNKIILLTCIFIFIKPKIAYSL